jgi:transposase
VSGDPHTLVDRFVKKPEEAFTLNTEQGNELIERLEGKSITDDDYSALITITRCYFWLILSLQEARISMHRFKEMIFGKKASKPNTKNTDNGTTEQSSDKTSGSTDPLATDKSNQGNDANQVSDCRGTTKPATHPDYGQGNQESPTGHGRLGADAYTGATDVFLEHAIYAVGMPCPQGLGRCGTLHRYKSGITITVDGFAPLQATRYHLEKLQCSGCRTIYTADLPPGVNSDEKYTPRAKAVLAVMHYGMAVPFNRLERLQHMMGVPFPDATQWDVVEQLGNHVYPVYDYLIYLGAQAQVIYQDDTWVRILTLMKENKHSDENARKGMYSTGLVVQTGGRTIVLFFSGRQHAGENIDRLLALREPDQGPLTKMSDALNANNPSDKTQDIIECNCNVHALRKFTEIEDFFPQATRKVIDLFKGVFNNERQVKKANLSDDERLRYHQKHSEPHMSAIKCFVEQQIKDKAVEPNSSLGKAYQYVINHWEKLTRFLNTPGAPLENNIVERALKWMIQVRNASRFYATLHGAYVGSMFISLIATCYYAKVNPIDYLTALQQHRSALFQHPQKWLPWNYHLNNSDPPR